MKVDDVLKCSFSSWYGSFSSATIQSAIIPLPSEVLDYLTADGIFVDGDHSHCEEADVTVVGTENSNQHTLPANFKRQINNSITELGGEVFPKLNWSSPKDAAWITPNHSLKCTNADEIFLLLKSSDFVVHDLAEPFLECEDASSNVLAFEYVLVLRKWADIIKESEFRCFVSDGELLGISQRHADSYFPALAENECHKERLITVLAAFFENEIKLRFPSNNYAFDVFIDANRVVLLDFNPWGIVTDSLLFTWDELQQMAKKEQPAATCKKTPELRVITDAAIRPADPFGGLHGVPLEYHRLAMDVGEGTKQPYEALLDLMQDQRLSDDDDMENQ